MVLWSSIETNKETRDETKAANMINSLELYMKIYEYKADALVAKEEHKIQKAEHFWRALLDLQFAEFRLCEQKFIDKGVFLIWTFARWLNYQDDAQTEHEVNGVTLQKVWNDLNNINYFQHKDNFLYFMKEVFALPKNNTSNWDEITKEIKEKIMVIINNYIP